MTDFGIGAVLHYEQSSGNFARNKKRRRQNDGVPRDVFYRDYGDLVRTPQGGAGITKKKKGSEKC
ncbi:MAG: hypothetical protein MJ033_01045 [Victivallaceae bacterium]|nr:hypothetical protein [Victivallaceae bacterium]